MKFIDPETGELKVPFLRSAYNYDRDEASLDAGTVFVGPSVTQQHFGDECNINTIVERFGLTGQLPDNIRMPTYGDFDQVNDFQTAMNAIRAAEESFMELPAHVRQRFHNDPARFVDFCSDESNRPEAVRLGLVPAPQPVQTAAPAPSSPETGEALTVPTGAVPRL